MKKIKLLICIFTVFAIILPIKVFANDSDWVIVESDFKSIKSEELNSFEESLKQKVKDLQEKDDNYIYRYSLKKVSTDIKEDTTEKKNVNVLNIENKFDSREDAISYYNNIKIEYPLYKGNYYQVQVYTDTDEDFYIDTTDEWDNNDRVGILIDKSKIKVTKAEDEDEKD